MYTVKQLSDVAGVTVRTLHYYDQIDLLKPSTVGENGYRYYGDEALLRLQQILFFREIDLGLLQIKDILDAPDFDLMAALRAHRHVLRDRINRLESLIQTVDSTILHLAGEVDLPQKQLFAGFSEEQQAKYEQEAVQQYGESSVRQSTKRWNSYTARQKANIQAEGGAIYTELVEAMPTGPDSGAVQAIMARWHQHLRYFYEPTPDILRGLGQLYSQSPDFIATFQRFHPDLPDFLAQAVRHYVDSLA